MQSAQNVGANHFVTTAFFDFSENLAGSCRFRLCWFVVRAGSVRAGLRFVSVCAGSVRAGAVLSVPVGFMATLEVLGSKLGW